MIGAISACDPFARKLRATSNFEMIDEVYKMKRLTMLASALALFAGAAHALPIVHNSDFIADGTRSHFNGFETIPNDGTFFTGGAGPYIEDTIAVEQISGDGGNDIWVSSSFWAGFQAARGWYPNGGDSGYTQLSLAGGIDFVDVGFNFGSGGSAQQILFELLDNGSVILAGAAALTNGVNYLGFSGGGFDTIRMRDTFSGAGGAVTDDSLQALAIDNIETQGRSAPVPEPSALALLALGLLGAGAFRRKQASV